MYEASPLGMIIEQAGGAAIDGTGRILDIEPTSLHQRVAVALGCQEEVAAAAEYMAQAATG
jgi:fructose-1,6-bisphosphatase I